MAHAAHGRCHSCRFWSGKALPDSAFIEDVDRPKGLCRRYPHAIEKAGTDWCGEWKPPSPPKKDAPQ